MKKLLATMLLMFSVAAIADDEIAVLGNEAGGEIVLTQKACPIPDADDFKLAYTWNAEIRFYGCWKVQSDSYTVHVLWVTPDGESHHKTYDSRRFDIRKSI
jgi:hypothetical protein